MELTMIIGSKNKGDWSEFYVLLYLLGTRNLYAADEHLNKNPSFCFPVNKIFRKEDSNKVDFELFDVDKIKIYLNDSLLRTMTSSEFVKEASLLFKDIIAGSGSFNIPRSEAFLNYIGCNRLTAPSDDVTDIKLELHDTITGINQIMGFSIKSYLGGAPSLLNASGATNFIYEVENLTDTDIKEINAIDTKTKILDRVSEITKRGGTIKFHGLASKVFSENLMMIDSLMVDFLAEALLYSYVTNEVDCKKIIDHIEITNPLKFPRKGFYEFKFKKFLCAKALGLNPSKPWTGMDDANGGYIVAKSNGEVLAYHLYNRDKFEQYLFDNTKLERASTSRHDYASLYKKDDKTFINLNLQIRFK